MKNLSKQKLSIFFSFLIIISCVESESSVPTTTTLANKTTTTLEVSTTTSTMGLSDNATEMIMSLPVVEFEDCTQEKLKVGDIYPLVINIGSSSSDIREVFIQIDDEASGISEYSFSSEDVAKKGQVRTYSLNLELLDYESNYTVFITAYAVDIEDNQDGKVCSILVVKSNTSDSTPDNPGDTKNCADFVDYAEAKAWFDTYYEYYGDVAKLDNDDDLEPCESLPGGP